MREIDQALYTALTGSTALMALASGIYRGIAPGSAIYPYISYMEQVSNDGYALSGRTHRTATYQVMAIDIGQTANKAGQIFTQIDAVLNAASLTASSWTTIYIRRETGIEYEERDKNEVYQHVGGLYSITVRPST